MNKYRYGKSPAAVHLSHVVGEYPKSVGRKVATSLSEFRKTLSQIDTSLNDVVFKLALKGLDTETDLLIPEKVETLMRNVKVTEKKIKEHIRLRTISSISLIKNCAHLDDDLIHIMEENI